MPTKEKDQKCDHLVQKLRTGESLDDAEKAHLASCESCMLHVVKALDMSASKASHRPGMAAGESIGDLIQSRPEAKRALEHGRRVLEREFGITPTQN